MATLLYIFPHPDDESFGPALAISQQHRQGHEVHLLTLTKGEATTQRERLGYTKEKMADVRYREMQDVADVLDFASMSVLDFPDGGLPEMDPLELEEVIHRHIDRVKPDVVVTYAVHGISGHRDHLVTHAVVKRVFSALREQSADVPRRLALFTLSEEDDTGRPEHLQGSPAELIDCTIPFDEDDRRRARAALDCYETYQDVIERHQPLKHLGEGLHFELFQESPRPRLDDLLADLP